MKKIFSLLVIMLVAAISVNASAQASKLVGKWNVDVSQMMDTSAMDDVKLTLRFDADNEGAIRLLIALDQPVDGDVSIHIEMLMDADLEWSLSGNVLTMQTTDFDVDITKIEVSPSRPEYEALLPQIKSMIQQQFEAEKDDMIGGISQGEANVRFIDNDIMILANDNSDELRCKRMR